MTGGRIKRIRDYLTDDEAFFLTYGDGVAILIYPSFLLSTKLMAGSRPSPASCRLDGSGPSNWRQFGQELS